MSIQTRENGQLGGPKEENLAARCLRWKQASQGQIAVKQGRLEQESAEELQSLGQKGVGCMSPQLSHKKGPR